MTDRVRGERKKEKSTGEYVASVIANVAVLVVINLHATWRPWTRGVVTEDWVRVLWAANLAAGVQLAGSLLLALARPAWLVRLGELAFSVVNLISAAVFYSVFPIDFSRVGVAWLNTASRVVLMIGLFGGSIAVVVNLVRLMTGGGPRRTVLHT